MKTNTNVIATGINILRSKIKIPISSYVHFLDISIVNVKTLVIIVGLLYFGMA